MTREHTLSRGANLVRSLLIFQDHKWRNNTIRVARNWREPNGGIWASVCLSCEQHKGEQICLFAGSSGELLSSSRLSLFWSLFHSSVGCHHNQKQAGQQSEPDGENSKNSNLKHTHKRASEINRPPSLSFCGKSQRKCKSNAIQCKEARSDAL